MKPLLTFFALLIFFALPFKVDAGSRPDQKDSIAIRKLWKQIAKENTFQIEGVISQSDPRLATIKKLTTPYDLLKKVMDDPNAYVRLYAFVVLADQMDHLPMEIINKIKSDPTPITVITGDQKKIKAFSEVANGFLK
ncbi:MAG TPA: hypothetical protein PLM81_11315 [Ginsengibacter sp.]|nr:hypothetical protein [Ginsengibacter sp.]HRP17696.1 hypothetical protein [Ginsengibacter sp.]HRP45238.1 hypothetical protein [Ginsengibacter sp.]